MSHMINKLAIKNFYEQHKEDYVAARQSGDTAKWDEQYKWDILPKLNDELKTHGALTDSNALQIVGLLQKKQSQQWFILSLDRLRQFAQTTRTKTSCSESTIIYVDCEA